jgi:hypothetical protein
MIAFDADTSSGTKVFALIFGGAFMVSGAIPRVDHDALDKIAKLTELRDKGALTEDEFSREKAKLLAEL